MTPAELHRLHVWLRAVRTCTVCGQARRVEAFAGPGRQPCRACVIARARSAARSDGSLDQWWAAQKAWAAARTGRTSP